MNIENGKVMEMAAMLIGFLFFAAGAMAIGTIAGMAFAYHEKALAALRMEHRPAGSGRNCERPYSPARLPRFTVMRPSVERPLRHRARAA